MIPTAAEIAYLQSLEPIPPHWLGTGALRRRPDARDYPALLHPGFRAVFEAEAAVDTDYANMVCSQTNQGATGSCVTHSTCYGIQVNENITQKVCYRFNPQQLYTELGGTGANGIDSRVALQRCKDVGAPLANSDKRLKVGSYYWIDPNQTTFVEQVKTALTAGKSVVIALLLPSTFGGKWTPGNPTMGYHQLDIVGTKGDLFWGPNSWGENWGGGNHLPGFYELSFKYCMADGFQHGYCYAYFFDSVPLDGTPPPPPPPPAKTGTLTGKVAGDGITTLATGQVYALGSAAALTVSSVTIDGTPPPPPSPLTVSGYSPNPVKGGGSFMIAGSGFQGGNLTASWQGGALVANRVSDTQIQSTAPSVTTSASGPVTVRVEGATAAGPPLMVTVDSQPSPGALLVKLYPRRRSAATVTLLAYCYRNGTPETATITGSIGATVLETRQAQIGSWTVTGLPPGSQTITVNATSANGSGTATAVI